MKFNKKADEIEVGDWVRRVDGERIYGELERRVIRIAPNKQRASIIFVDVAGEEGWLYRSELVKSAPPPEPEKVSEKFKEWI